MELGRAVGMFLKIHQRRLNRCSINMGGLFVVAVFQTGSCYIAQADLGLLPPECWGY
jgi:hypothetical protein